MHEPSTPPPARPLDAIREKVTDGRPLTISEAALWLGVDRNTLAANLRIIPIGQPPLVPAGQVPCRQLGSRRLIFPADLLGTATATSPPAAATNLENDHGQPREATPANPRPGQPEVDRPLDRLRHWRRRSN